MKILRPNYIVLFILTLVFVAPGLFAIFLYSHPRWLGDKTTNNGVLLTPPVLLINPQKLPMGPKWQLVLWSPTSCKKNCLKQLEKLARIRLALGRHLYNVEVLLVMANDAAQLSNTLVRALQEQDIHITRLFPGEREHILVFREKLALFIANPDDYLVLTYPANVKPDAIYHDLKQLLIH